MLELTGKPNLRSFKRGCSFSMPTLPGKVINAVYSLVRDGYWRCQGVIRSSTCSFS